MNIAFDYDDTISADPKLFTRIMQTFAEAGHKVYVVTYRESAAFEDLRWLAHLDAVTDVVFTGCQAKDRYCKTMGINIDIWIDDNPVSITHSFNTTDWFTPDHDDLKYWGKTKDQQ